MRTMDFFETKNDYVFQRYFVKDLKDFLQSNYNVLFSMGPRKCGKTVALKQLAKEFRAEYHDFKVESGKDTVIKIEQSILQNEEKIYLLDEITYKEFADRDLARWASDFDDVVNTKTKIIVTGSQSLAIRSWGHRAFSSTAKYLDISFLSYSEWLAYEEKQACTETFNQFIWNTETFYKFSSIREYLQSCIDETIVSNSKSLNILFNNDCEDLTVDLLVAVLYTVMFTLHNHVSVQSYKNSRLVPESIKYWFNQEISLDACKQLDSIYSGLKGMNYEVFKKAIWFLVKTGLITLTYFSQGIEDVVDIEMELTTSYGKCKSISEFFKHFNVCIKYPMFYISLLKELGCTGKLPGPLIGSVVECYIRGLLGTISYEYRKNDKEIDFIDYSSKVAIEFSISGERVRDTNFSLLGEGWTCFLLTKDQEGTEEIQRIPYWKYVLELEEKQKERF